MTSNSPKRPRFGNRIWSPKDGYNLVAPVYDNWYWQPFWHRNEKPYLENLTKKVQNPQLSLDLGCGTGAYCHLLEKRGRVVGVDPSIEMLRVARHNIQQTTSLICSQASAIPLRTETIDITIAARALSHEPNLEAAFDELGRITREDGVCILSDVHGDHAYPRTRIALGNQDVHIQTFKRTPAEAIDSATRSSLWRVEECREFGWTDLFWQPNDERFFRIDRSGALPVFFILLLRKTHN